jgi:hypothetical protein
VNNTFYLHAQVRRRKASVKGLFAGVDQWRKRGRSVRDGEKPYVIFGPPSFLVRTPNAAQPGTQAAAAALTGQQQGQQPPAAQQPVRMFRRPPTIEVYDWTQTEADDPDYVEPDWAVPLAYGDLDTLHLLAGTSPVPVTFTDLGSRNEHGWLDSAGITADSSRPVGNRISTVLHELAHYHLEHLEKLNSTAAPVANDDEQSSLYAQCEQEAALAQFLAMKMLGLDETVGNNVTQAAGEYLRSWLRTDSDGKTVTVEGHKTKRKLVLKRFDAAFKAADKIVSAYVEASLARTPVAASV